MTSRLLRLPSRATFAAREPDRRLERAKPEPGMGYRPVDPTAYAELLRRTYRAAKAATPM